jgi:hypothetical protein
MNLQRFFMLTLIVILVANTAEARHRLPTYIDANGVRRVQKTGKIYRDYAAVREFKRTHPKPDDGQAYDVDHIKPLTQGGTDTPSNMRWVLTSEHRTKNGRPKKSP